MRGLCTPPDDHCRGLRSWSVPNPDTHRRPSRSLTLRHDRPRRGIAVGGLQGFTPLTLGKQPVQQDPKDDEKHSTRCPPRPQLPHHHRPPLPPPPPPSHPPTYPPPQAH